MLIYHWLVVEPHPSEKYDFVNWDDEIPNISGKIEFMFQSPPDNALYYTCPMKNRVLKKKQGLIVWEFL